jgi:hypothetical protein|tara:strand:+ start:2960 stop:3190 length:231 start_codon:yes stop_codon:yes gene_type:complete
MTTVIVTKTPPAECDLCYAIIADEFVDAAIRVAPGRTSWANVCLDCHSRLGVGLGTGKGQRYKLNIEMGEYEKVEG